MSTVDYPNLAFIGGMGSGKSTCAAIAERTWGYERLSFATPLKVMAGPDAPRSHLQNIGIGVRALCADAWVNLLLDEMDRMDKEYGNLAAPHPPRFVVDDCRFPNEAEALRREGFIFVRVVAGDDARVARLTANGKWGGWTALRHESETALNDFQPNYYIYNTGSMAELANEVANVVNGEAR